MTPQEAADRIRAARDVAVLIRAPSGDYDVVDVTADGAAALRKIGPQWVLGIYPIVDGQPTREEAPEPVAKAPLVVPIGRRRADRRPPL